jgi:hypothetical protein
MQGVTLKRKKRTMKKATATHKMKSLHGAILFAAGIGCALPSMAQTPLTKQTPMSLLPEVFTRLDYVTDTGVIRSETEQSPAMSTPETNDSEIAYAEEDLELALENFFYALEDLVQSASRYEASVPSRQNNYYTHVQFPAQVMNSLANRSSSDRATNTVAAAATTGDTTLPPIRARQQDNTASGSLAEFELSGNTQVNLEHNDNIYTTRTNTQSDQILTISLNGIAESRSRTRAIKFEGSADKGNYNLNPDNNFTDWSATSSYSTLLGSRSKGFLGLGYFYHHEEKGEGSTDGNQAFSIDEPIEFESWVTRGIYELGSQQARTRFVADGKLDVLRTTNFRDTPEIIARDRDIASFIGTAYYKRTRRLSYLTELRHMDISYVNALNNNSLDSTQTRLALGAEWLATRKTAGSFRVGLQEKQYDNPTNQDTSRVSWEAVVEWAPKPRTEIVLETIQDTEESDGFGAARDRTDFKVTWSQRWTPRIDTSTSLQYGTTDFQESQREDQLNLFDTELTYSFSTRAAASLKLTYIDNSSNVVEYGFERSQIQLGVNLELD